MPVVDIHKVVNDFGECGMLLEFVKKKTLRAKRTLANIIVPDKVDRKRGRPARPWLDNVKEWA